MDELPRFTMIGDIVGSRKVESRVDLQSSLRSTLLRLCCLPSFEMKLTQPLETTVGDEFQGVFRDLASAVGATILIRLELLKETGVDSRYGLGFGPVSVFDEQSSPVSQDGPGWWSARRAIEEVQGHAEMPQSSFTRTRFRVEPGVTEIGGGEEAAMNSFLTMRDATVDEMKPRARRILLGYLQGESQSRIAADEGVSQSNVSQTLGRSGAHAIKLAQDKLDWRDR